jgi:propanol-preferring alcohol dehydrogenase
MIPSERRAARLYQPGSPLRVESVSVPVIQAHEVLVEVAACGLCGTDVHLAVAGDIPVARTPITLGHEAAGMVVAMGASVKDLQPAQRVALFPSAVCGECRFCRSGRESLCESAQVYGMSRDGALAQYIAAPWWCAVPIPEGISYEQACIITDGVATPFHALRSRGALKAGESVAVVGCGGLGTHAILLARMMGAGFIVAIDVDASARDRSVALGADLALNPREEKNIGKSIRQRIGRGVDLALECVGRAETVAAALQTLDTGGRAIIVGVGPEKPELPPLIRFVGREFSVLGSFGMDKRDIADLLRLVACGRLDLGASVTEVYPLQDVNTALDRLASGDSSAVRLVIAPGQQ